MPDALPVILVAWSALCGVWVVLLLVQRRAARDGLLLRPCVRADGSRSWPAVAVVVPARNESAAIAACVGRILRQDYPGLSLTVADDRSEDDTAEIVSALAEHDPRLRLQRIRSLPQGWLAKSHALWIATRDLDADWLLFVDADASLHPAAVRTAVVEAERRGADLLTLFPRNAAIGFWEHLVIPLCGGIIALWFGGGGRGGGGNGRAFANGQFLLVRREVYERAGGHAAVRDALIEDVPLAEACAAAGAATVAAGGAELVGVRMYDRFRGVCDGWTRIFAGALRSPLKLLVSVLWLVFGSLLPHAALPVLVWRVAYNPTTYGLLLLAVCAQHLGLIYLVSYRFWTMGRCDRRYLWLYPLSVLIVIALLFRAAWVLTAGRTVTWRGVCYRIDSRARLRPPAPGHAGPAWRSRAAWTAWLLLAVACAAGLRHHRIDNSLDSWLPELRAVGRYPSYAVIGWETAGVSHGDVAGRVAADVRGVAMIIDRPAVARFGALAGVTAEDFVASRDGSYEGMFIFRDAGVSDATFVSSLRRTLSPLRGVAIGGPAVYAVTLEQLSQQRMPLVMGGIATIGLILLTLLTGSLRAASAGVAAITISQVVLVGGLAWCGVPLDMSLMMVPPLMMSLGMSYAAHRAMGRGNVGVLALCGLTSALGIGTFVLTPLPPIRAFALAGLIGLGVTWLAVVTLVPRATPARRRLRPPGLSLALSACIRHRGTATAAAGLFAAALPLAAPQLRFVSDPLSYFPGSSRCARDFEVLDRRLTGMLPFQVITGDARARPLLEQTPGVRKVIDITPAAGGDGDKDGRHTYWCLADNAALPRLVEAQPAWLKWAGVWNTRIEWRGVAAQLCETERILRDVAAGSLAGMAALAGTIVMLRTRRAALAILAILLTLLPVAMVVTGMAAFNFPLSLASLMIGSISIGIAVDDVLHLTCGADARRSVRRALVRCWRPCVGSSLINVATLSCFAMSPFAPTRQFGLLLAAAAACSCLVNQFVLPAMLNAVAVPRS